MAKTEVTVTLSHEARVFITDLVRQTVKDMARPAPYASGGVVSPVVEEGVSKVQENAARVVLGVTRTALMEVVKELDSLSFTDSSDAAAMRRISARLTVLAYPGR